MAAQLGASAVAARAHEEMFSYWASLRKGGRLPSRADFQPGFVKRLLPTVSLIDVKHEPRDYRLRLAGTGLYSVYGREITGHSLNDVYNSAAADYWRAELDKIVDAPAAVERWAQRRHDPRLRRRGRRAGRRLGHSRGLRRPQVAPVLEDVEQQNDRQSDDGQRR